MRQEVVLKSWPVFVLYVVSLLDNLNSKKLLLLLLTWNNYTTALFVSFFPPTKDDVYEKDPIHSLCNLCNLEIKIRLRNSSLKKNVLKWKINLPRQKLSFLQCFEHSKPVNCISKSTFSILNVTQWNKMHHKVFSNHRCDSHIKMPGYHSIEN